MKKDQNIIYCYKWSISGHLSKWDRLTNWLWFHAGESDQLWAKMIFYPLQWLEQRIFDSICLIGKHFPDPDDNKCIRCNEVLDS